MSISQTSIALSANGSRLFASRIAPPLFGALAPWRLASVKKIRSLSTALESARVLRR
jgi:hypothetical protein